MSNLRDLLLKVQQDALILAFDECNSTSFEQPVTQLGLSLRAKNCLFNTNIKTIGELIQYTEVELMKTSNFGKKSLQEIKDELAKVGLRLGASEEKLVSRYQQLCEQMLPNMLALAIKGLP